jgi:hypothetical protein
MGYDAVEVDAASSVAKSGRDLLLDTERQFTEDEKRGAIQVQSAFRSSSQRKDYGKLKSQGLSSDAVDFQRAVKESQRMPAEVTPAANEVPLEAPVGALLAIYRFHGAYKTKAVSNFWGLWKCSISNTIADLPLQIMGYFFLLCFTAAYFYVPMWAAITIRFMFYDGEGQVMIDQFAKWLMCFAVALGSMFSLSTIMFTLLQERFGNRIKTQVGVVASQFGKLISQAEADRFRNADLAATKRVLFWFVPMGISSFLVVVAGLNFLFIRSPVIGAITVASILFSAVFLAVYDRFVRDHSAAVEDVEATEREFWTYLNSREKDVAMSEIVALAAESAKFSIRQALYHITMGALYRAVMLMTLVLVVFVGSTQISDNDMKQYELLFCFFYYAFTMSSVQWLNSSTVSILTDLGASFRLTSFVNSTKHCMKEFTSTRGDRDLEVVQRLAAKQTRMPFGVVVLTLLLVAGCLGSFISTTTSGTTAMACKSVEMVCNICGHASHVVSVPQYFDMQSGCQFEWTPQQMADHCLSTVPNPTESEGVRKLLSVRRLGSAEARCDVHMTYLSGDGDDNGYHVPQEEVVLPEARTCQEACAAPGPCQAEGKCQKATGLCTYPILGDGTACTSEGAEGKCRAGNCDVTPLKPGMRRKLADKDAEQTWHAKRRLRQLAHVSNTKLTLTPFEKNAMARIQANKQAQVEQFAEVNRRRLQQDSTAMPATPEHSVCPLPGQEDTGDCPGAKIRGCTDEAGLNYNPQATIPTQCCYAPNRYVKVDMTESVFRENFWTIHVDGSLAGVGLPLVGSDEVCVPQESCVKVTTYDDSCDGMIVGGGGISVASRVVIDEEVHTIVDSDVNFECSKKVQFGSCPIEGCTDKLAMNYNALATEDDASCQYIACAEGEKAVVVDIKYDGKKEETSWKLTDAEGVTLVDSENFDNIYAGDTANHFYCFPSEKCLYFLIKDAAGDGMDASGQYTVKYGAPQALHTVATGNEFDYIRAHFVGGSSECAKQ